MYFRRSFALSPNDTQSFCSAEWLRMTSFFMSFCGRSPKNLLALSCHSEGKARKILSHPARHSEGAKRLKNLLPVFVLSCADGGRFDGKATETSRTLRSLISFGNQRLSKLTKHFICWNMVLSCTDKKVPQRSSRQSLRSLINCNCSTQAG